MNSAVAGIVVVAILGAGILAASSKPTSHGHSTPSRQTSSRNNTHINYLKEEEFANNSGELFQPNTQKVLGALKKNDLLIFDNINMSLVDGSTRTAAPIIYKIID